MTQVFKKTSKQIEATRLAADALSKHIMLYGGSRSGKSFVHCRNIFVRASKTPSRHLIGRLRFNHVKTSIWHETIPKVLSLCFPNLNAKPNKSDYFYYLPNGSEIWIAGFDDKERTEKILGKEYSTIWFNECSQLPYETVSIALTRLAEKNSLSKKVYYDQNPPSKKHWAYWVWEKHFNPVSEATLDPNEYVSLLMNPMDNIENIDENYLTILESLPEKKKQRFMHGIYTDSDDGLAYYEFSQEKHVKPVIQNMGTVFIGMDFNVHPMTAVICQIMNNKIYVLDELFLENSDTFKMCHELKKKGYTGCSVIPDSTGGNRKTSGFSDHQILKDNNFKVIPTFNPYVTDRVNNVNRLLKSDSIIIDPRCKKLVADLNQVSWKNNEIDKKTNAMLTHISDCLGYVAWKIMPMVGSNLKVTTQQR